MADQSDVTKGLFDSLPPADEPAGWRSAPVIDCWSLEASPNQREVAVAGVVVGSEKFNNCSTIRSSALRAIDADRRFVITQNTTYQLGWPARASLEADADHQWPTALAVAACSNWQAGVEAAVRWTGWHTLPESLKDDLVAAMHDDGDWQERRAACRAIAQALREVHRNGVAEAWTVLETDLRSERDRNIAATFVNAAALQAYHQYERALTAQEALADSGWRLLFNMDPAQVEKLPGESVPIDDPIAAAHKMMLIALGAGVKRNRLDLDGGVFDDVYVDPGSDPEPPAYKLGVVVLREVGGLDTNWSGREVKRAIGAILGKRLPLRPAPDTAAIRRVLAAEFPYALNAIDVMLSDLVGAPYARFRASILVGPAGAGKSRLATRIAEMAGLHIHFFDCAGTSDNAFSGTARRWSTGEPATPVLAMIAAKAANAVILIDELDKAAGTGGHNGRLWDAVLPYLERTTAARAVDPYLHSPVDCSHLSYIATANDERQLPGPLRDRFRILRIPTPTAEDLPALCRGIVTDLARESGIDREWTPPLDEDELWMAAELWRGGSVRRLREIVACIVTKRAEMPRH